MPLPTPEQLAEIDQANKIISDTFPGLWWDLYSGCLYRGFDEVQALELVKEYIRKP